MTEQLITSRRDGAVAYVTLDRPAAGNLVTYEMMGQLAEALSAAKSVDVLVVGAGGEDFSAGRDHAERPAGVTPAAGLERIAEVNGLLGAFGGISVALVRGRALGFGSGLAVQCDITVASDTAVFGFDEIRHGFPPLVVESYLTRYVPWKPALELVLTGRRIPASEARALGMVSRIVPDGELDAVGEALVAGLCAASPSALRRAKAFLGEVGAVPEAERGLYGVRELASWRKQQALGRAGRPDGVR